MLRRRINSLGSALRFVDSENGNSSSWNELGDHSLLCNSNIKGSPLLIQRRFSFKYVKKTQHNEARQPSYIHDKRYGLFSNERNVLKARRGLPHITPLYTKHMSLWETDTDETNNRFFRNYVFGQRELHQLLGRPHAFESNEAGGKQGDSAYELNTDMRYKGVPRSAITNLYFEPEWNTVLYQPGSNGSFLNCPRSPLTEEILGDELIQIRDIKSLEHCEMWFKRLQYLIKLHYDAVGDIGDFQSRHTQHVHEFFVAFHDALSSFDFQDTYLFAEFKRARPKELEDLFGIFLEMEGNYVNEDYCPRCSLPFSTTRFCGEGDPNTPFRKHRGRWAPHQKWGKEWYTVVMRRAEALWYRSTEDPYFGHPEHTQRQVEAMLNVYIKTKSRAKAVDFLTSIRGSKEFLIGKITITDRMQKDFDHLLDITPHQHLLTNAYTLENRASVYTGATNKVPLSPLQFRIDLELDKYRRQQKEEGVVKVPPSSWKLDTTAIVPYRVDSKTKHITNWREVKSGIEQSFLSTGLPKEAYSPGEWREVVFLEDRLKTKSERTARLQKELEDQKKSMDRTSANSVIVFPDKDWYRVFDITKASLAAFNNLKSSGLVFSGQSKVFPDPKKVSMVHPVTKKALSVDVTSEALELFGGYEHGDLLFVSPSSNSIAEGRSPDARVLEQGEEVDVVVVGINKEGMESEWELIVAPVNTEKFRKYGYFSLGRDVEDMRHLWSIRPMNKKALLPSLRELRTATEEHLGQVVGVRNGELYVQWRLLSGGGSSVSDRSVACSLGNAEMVKSLYTFQDSGLVESLVDPPSWRTPFRNESLEERLKRALRAPFERESWASLIKGKYTPKKKRFGYTQHITQDDFMTDEYKTRLLSRQFFHEPQAFQIIPERKEKSVSFAGKWEYQRVNGLPTVDRAELENGWAEVDKISDEEVSVIEQALRDISGRRPGNFIKSDKEVNSIQIDEPWWQPLEFGWEYRNREQKALVDPTEQKIINGTKLPFRGKHPTFGSSDGMGERIRDVADDFSKGFGLGPHGHSPGNVNYSFNTLGHENIRTETLGYGNVLVRLFDEKLGSKDIHQWALEQCSQAEADVRRLLLSVQEWREKGRAPSLMLSKVLSNYLREEIELYNDGVPEGAVKLSLLGKDNESTTSGTMGSGGNLCDDGNIWVDVDRTVYAMDVAKHRPRISSSDPFILTLIYQSVAAEKTERMIDESAIAFFQQNLWNQFQLEVARVAGKGIPPTFIAQKTSQIYRGSVKSSGSVIPFVKGKEIEQLLLRYGVTTENVSTVLLGLMKCPEHEPLGDDFVVPSSLIFTWGGPGTETSSTPRNRSAGGNNANRQQQQQQQQQRRGGSASAISQVLHGMRGATGERGSNDRMVVHALDELSLRDDGYVMDVKYAIEQNSKNALLRREFFTALLPVFNKDHAKVSKLYRDYCQGKYVPNITVAIESFITFLSHYCQNHESLDGIEYFEMDQSGKYPGQCIELKLLPPTLGPFQFENTLAEKIETFERFEKYHIREGPTKAPITAFIAPNSKSMNYFTNRPDDVARVTLANDQGLRLTLQKSNHFKVISSNPAMRFLLDTANSFALVLAFNRYVYRVMPMLHFYEKILLDYRNNVQDLHQESQSSANELSYILENEQSGTIEQEFRRNVERYWKNILDGHSANEYGSGGSTFKPRGQQDRLSSPSRLNFKLDINKAAGDETSASSRGSRTGRNENTNRSQVQSSTPSGSRQGEARNHNNPGNARTTMPRSSNSNSGSKGMNDLLSKLKKRKPQGNPQK